LAAIATQKGLELPAFKTVLLLGAYAVRYSDPLDNARKVWIDAVSRRLETETRSTAPKTGNSFDDSSSEDEASPATEATSVLVYDFTTLERLYSDFIMHLWTP
jgi:hypothetical protein